MDGPLAREVAFGLMVSLTLSILAWAWRTLRSPVEWDDL